MLKYEFPNVLSCVGYCFLQHFLLTEACSEAVCVSKVQRCACFTSREGYRTSWDWLCLQLSSGSPSSSIMFFTFCLCSSLGRRSLLWIWMNKRRKTKSILGLEGPNTRTLRSCILKSMNPSINFYHLTLSRSQASWDPGFFPVSPRPPPGRTCFAITCLRGAQEAS